MTTRDPLSFPDYQDEVDATRETGLDESVVAGSARIGGNDVEVAAFSFEFFGGSMGEVTGERIATALERAASRQVPFVLRTSTGGARMQEGMRSLVQMSKLVAARLDLADAAQPFVVVLGHPTTGGVLASIASLADVTVAEAGATIGFAGPRVAERVTGTPLPDGSHTATSAYSSGLVDDLVSAADVHSYVAAVLNVLGADTPYPVEAPIVEDEDADAWDLVAATRSSAHPKAPELVREASESMVELRGDRSGGDDPAVRCALVRIAGRKLMAIALDREHRPGPHGYRKARRCLEIAGRLQLPVMTLIDTPGAEPGASSESGGIAWEIGALFEAMLEVPVPVLAVVTGEGGSGGALAFATSDRIVAFERSFFSVIGPESAAEILWRDASRASEAAAALRLTARDLRDLAIADELIPGVASPHSLKHTIATQLAQIPWGDDVASRRRARWRAI